MPSDLVQRLRNLHAHSGDPDTVEEAARSLEQLSEYLKSAKQHIDRLEELCRQQAADIAEVVKDCKSLMTEADILREMLVERDRQLAEAVKIHIDLAKAATTPVPPGTPLTDEQARKVLAAVMEVQP